MKEFNEEYDDEFFIIDSINLEDVENRFYGYMIHENKIITNDTIDENITPTGHGVYLWVKVNENSIKIIQDFNGSYGVYIYRQGEYFAISNSYLKLAEYLKDSHKLTLNQDYANSFLFADLCSFGYNNTLINEINLIPRFYEIEITISNSKIRFNKLDLNEKSIDLDSEKGIEILDSWFENWINIIRSIKYETDNVQFDLTGGFDSRAVSALWLSSNIDLNRCFIKTIENSSRRDLIEDYEISSEIANKFNFELNNSKFKTGIKGFNERITPILLSFYTKLGFHKGINFSTNKYEEFVYTVNGRGGETIRNYYNQTPKEYVEKYLKSYDDKGNYIKKSTEKILNDSFDRLSEDYPNLSYDSIDLPEQLYKEVRCRNHFGKIFAEEYNHNIINLAPLLDPQLQKLKLTTNDCDDRDLLLALIFIRFMPELLEFKVPGNRKISEDTIETAKKINDKYPLVKKTYSYIDKPKDDTQKREYKKGNVNSGECTNYIKNIFNSYEFECEFKKYFPTKFYNQIFNEINRDHPRLNNIYSAMAILNALNYTKENPKTIEKWLDDFLNSPKVIEDNENKLYSNDTIIFKTARIDLVNEGNAGCSLDLISIDDPYCKIEYPKWLQKENKTGIIVTSEKCELDLKIKCITDGRFKIFLRALNLKDKNRHILPIFIDFQKLTINNKNFLEKNKLLCYNDHFNVNFDIKDSEILDIHIEWRPLNESSEWISTKF